MLDKPPAKLSSSGAGNGALKSCSNSANKASVSASDSCRWRAAAESRKVHFAEHNDFVDTAVYVRSRLPVGERIKGPALVEEYASTTVVFPGDELEVGAFGDLIITIDRR